MAVSFCLSVLRCAQPAVRGLAGLCLLALVMSTPVRGHEAGLGSLGCHSDREVMNYHCHEGALAGRVFPSRQEAIATLAGELEQGRGRARPTPPPAPSREQSTSVVQVPRGGDALVGPVPALPPMDKAQGPMTGTEIFERVSPSVYILLNYHSGIDFQKRRPQKQGSAVAISKNLALTNCHVLVGGSRFMLYKNKRMLQAIPHTRNPESDRCIVYSSEPLTPVAHVRDFHDVKVGEKVFSVGSPNGLENTLGEGLLSGKRNLKGHDLLQTTAPISPGSSGGGLFDANGNLLGITTFLLRNAQNLNFAIPVDGYLSALKQR